MPALRPDAFELRPATIAPDDPAAMPVRLPELPGLDARLSIDGVWHGLWQAAGAEYQLRLDAPPLNGAAAYIIVLPLDLLFETRAAAVIRFWRALQGRPPGEWRHDLPPQTRDRLILMLRALDGRQAGASYRKIAEVLLGFRGSKAEWESDPRKNQARRLVADGLRIVHGGYRDLLTYPVRLRRSR